MKIFKKLGRVQKLCEGRGGKDVGKCQSMKGKSDREEGRGRDRKRFGWKVKFYN